MYIHDVKFRFIIPQVAKGSDYDVELFYPDSLAVAADAKCKFETTDINPKSIVNSLEIGRKKLPADRPGIIFIKVPQRWIARAESAVEMVDAGRKFLRNTDRIAAITFYVSHLETRDNVVMHRHALLELTNNMSRFYQKRN